VRRSLLLERCQGVTGETAPCTGLEYTGSQTRVTGSAGVVTATHKFIRTFDGQRQLFDLVADPNEMVNLAGHPQAAVIQAQLETKLDTLLAPKHVDTTILDRSFGTISKRAVTFHAFTQSRYANFRCRLTRNDVHGTWHACDGDGAVEGGLRDGDYTFEIKAIDERGRADASPASRHFSVASTGPRVTVTGSPPASTTSSQLAFGFRSQISGLIYECRLSSWGTQGAWSPCSPATGVSYQGLGEGLWNFEVRATDPAGSTTHPPAAWLTSIDRSGPALTWAAHPWSPTKARDATFRFVGDELAVGVPRCKLDGVAIPCTPRLLQVNGLAPGQHSVSVTVRDALKNKKTSTYSWTVEQTPPVITFVDGPASTTNSHNATFELASDEVVSGFLCALDGGLFMPCPDRVTWFGFASGQHTLQAWAVDRALNRSVVPATYTWTIT